MGGDGPETVLLHEVRHRCRSRWQKTTGQGGPWAAYVRIGTLEHDGRWYVEVVWINADVRARIYGTEAEARQIAGRWMERIGGGWEQIPCDPTAEAIPEARRRAQERAQPSTGSQEYSGELGSNGSDLEQR